MPRVESEYAGHAKAAMEYLVRTNAMRFAPRNATVNAVIPGIVETEAWGMNSTEVRPSTSKLLLAGTLARLLFARRLASLGHW